MSFSFTSSQVKQYNCNASGTNSFYVTIDEEKGIFTVKYCCGVVSSQWSNQAGKLQHFLTSIDDHCVFKDLIGEKEWFDFKKTNDNIKRTFLRNRYNQIISKKKAAEFWEDLELFYATNSYEVYLAQLLNARHTTEALNNEEFFVNMKETVFDYEPKHQFFINKIWPHIRSNFLNRDLVLATS